MLVTNLGDHIAAVSRMCRGGMLSDESRRLLEDLWRTKMQAAHERYREAAVQSQSVMRKQQEGLLIGADGFHAAQKALREESAALSEYRRVLNIFTELLVGGRLPTQE
ncbi:MAG TPA: hypothetical protein VKB88_20020 [Bryobacteraceae bacterium]|nr:hypothetical protein [Bryobacteraceae bacterium]